MLTLMSDPRRKIEDAAKNGKIATMTHEELEALADIEATEMLGVTRLEAFAMLDRGELRGSVAEAELRMLRFMLEENQA